MKHSLILTLVLLCAGCMTPRVPETVMGTPFGFDLRSPKDTDFEIEGLQYQRNTNGVVILTAKMVRTRSRNNPAVIDASSEQIKNHWEGAAKLGEGLAEKLMKGAVSGASPLP